MGRRAFIYCRISQDRTGAGLGVQRQELDCRQLAVTHGLDVVEVFIDNDVSAYSGKPRPGYRAMLDGLRGGGADHVLCWHTDRLHRSPVELEEYIDVSEQFRVTTQTVKAGELDLATPAGRMVARMLGSAARYESEHKSDRAKRKMEELTRKGKFTGGYRPFGWTIDGGMPTLHPAEAPALRELFHSALEGASLGSMARRLNEAGLTSTLGNQFQATTVRQILLRPRNAGLATYHGETVGPSEFPAIVSEDVYRAVRSLLTDPKRGRYYSNRPKFLLVGIAQCHCGSKMITGYVRSGKKAPYPVYRCPVKGTGHAHKRVNLVDEWVNLHMARVRSYATRHAATGQDSAESDGLNVEVIALRDRLNEAASMAAAGTITMSQLGTMTEQIRERLDSAESRLAELAMSQGLPPAPPVVASPESDAASLAEWLALPIDTRREYVRRVANVVLLSHFKGSPRVFDSDTVLVVLKTASTGRGPLSKDQIDDLMRDQRERGLLPPEGPPMFKNHRPGGDLPNRKRGSHVEVPQS